MFGIRLRSLRRFSAATVVLVFCAAAFVSPTMAAQTSPRIPDLSGQGPVAGLVGIEGGVVSGVINLESLGVEAPGRRPRHEECYQQA